VSEQDVLDLIRQEGPLTRAHIARRCKVSKPTVSAAVEGLIAAGLVREEGAAPSERPGRPGRLLAFEPSAGYVVGMDIGGTSLRAQLADLTGTPVAEWTEPTAVLHADELVEQIIRVRDRLVGEHERARGRLRAVAIGTPGVVDPMTHCVRYAQNVPALEHSGFFKMLSNAWNVPLRLGNDVNLAAIGEARLDKSRHVPDFVFVSIGTGLGFGLVRDGILYQGSSGRAGELGYLPYPPGGSTTIETFVSGPGISTEHHRLGGSGLVRDAFDEADRGEAPGRVAIDRFLADLAWLLTILSTLLDPHKIVLGGGIGVRCGPYLSTLRQSLAELSPIRPDLSVSELAGRAGLIGAVHQALDVCRPIENLTEGGLMQKN
jgi:predicted NBD/HSP70 family sugar kinase